MKTVSNYRSLLVHLSRRGEVLNTYLIKLLMFVYYWALCRSLYFTSKLMALMEYFENKLTLLSNSKGSMEFCGSCRSCECWSCA